MTSNFLARFGGCDDCEVPEAAPSSTSLDSFVDRFSGISQSYFFYNGQIEIVYDDVEHTYHRIGDLGQMIPLLNVSTISHIVDQSMRLIPWAAKVTIEKLLRTLPFVDGMLTITLEAFTAIAMEAKKAHKETLEDAGEVGKMAHSWLEKYIKRQLAGESTEDMFPIYCEDPRAIQCVQGALEWMRRHNVRWLATERKVFSRTYDYSGTMDGRGLVDSCDDPLCCPHPFKDRHSLIDWKTSNYLKTEYLFQTAGYEHAEEEEFPENPIEDRWINRLGKEEGEFEPWHCGEGDFTEDFEGFLACLALRRLVDSIEERMSKRKKYIRESRKQAAKEAKAIAKAAEKAAKCAERAAERIRKAEEKLKLRAEAKRLKAEVKAEREAKLEISTVDNSNGLICDSNGPDRNISDAAQNIADAGKHPDLSPAQQQLGRVSYVDANNPSATPVLGQVSSTGEAETNTEGLGVPQVERTTGVNDAGHSGELESGAGRVVFPSVHSYTHRGAVKSEVGASVGDTGPVETSTGPADEDEWKPIPIATEE